MPVRSAVKAQRRAAIEARSRKAKVGGACSAAVSTWVKGRKGGAVPPAVYATLAKCRSAAKATGFDHDEHSDKVAALRGTTLKGRRVSPYHTGHTLGFDDAAKITGGRKHEKREVYTRLAKGRKADETEPSRFYEGYRHGLRDRLEDSPHKGRRRVRALLTRHLA
jgi:hypothetical protein